MVESRNAESIITGIVTDGGNITTSGVLEIGTALLVTNANAVEIVLLVDESGSMVSVKEDTMTDATITFDSSPTWTINDGGDEWVTVGAATECDDCFTLPKENAPKDGSVLKYEAGSDTITWKPPTLEAFTVTIDGKVLLQGKELSKQYFESIEQRIINLETREDYAMFTTMNILIIMLIVIVTVKFVMPKLTIKYILRKFANLVYKPGKKAKEEIEVEWEKAKVE